MFYFTGELMNNLIIHIHYKDEDTVFECRSITAAYRVLRSLRNSELLSSVLISSSSFKVKEDLTNKFQLGGI